MKRPVPQFDLAVVGDVFNLAGQPGIDPERLARELEQSRLRRQEAARYQERMQLTLAQCPGFVGADAPAGPGLLGKVVVEPSWILEANRWLKRRFHVSENIELSGDTGIVLEIASRARPCKKGGRKVRVAFGPAEQFELALQ